MADQPFQKIDSVCLNPLRTARFIARLREMYPDGVVTNEDAICLLVREFRYQRKGAGAAWTALRRSGYVEFVSGEKWKVHDAPHTQRHLFNPALPCDILEQQLERLMDLALFRRGINRTQLRREIWDNKERVRRALKHIRKKIMIRP